MQTCPAKKIKSQCVKETSKFLHLDHRKLEQMIPRKKSSPIEGKSGYITNWAGGTRGRGGWGAGARAQLLVRVRCSYVLQRMPAPGIEQLPAAHPRLKRSRSGVRACARACACLRERGCVGAWKHPGLCVRACAPGGALSRVCVASACAGDCLPQLQ